MRRSYRRSVDCSRERSLGPEKLKFELFRLHYRQTLGPFMGEYESGDMCGPIKSTPIPLEE